MKLIIYQVNALMNITTLSHGHELPPNTFVYTISMKSSFDLKTRFLPDGLFRSL